MSTPSNRHYVYLIADEGGRTKIGHSCTPKRRLGNLQIGSPSPLEIFHLWAVPDRQSAERLEGALHIAFKPVRLKGEWFDVEAKWPQAVGDALLRQDDATTHALLRTLANFLAAKEIAAEYAADDDEEEADLWAGVCQGYTTCAERIGLARDVVSAW